MPITLRSVSARRRLVWVVCAGLHTTFAVHPHVRADEGPARAAGSIEAKRLFTHGSALYLTGQYAEALEALQTSHKLVPSPNSELVIARCLRGLGRLVEAKEMFESAEVEARRRAADGAAKYLQTAETAGAEGAAVRASLGTIDIRIDGVDSATKLEVDAVPTDVPPGGEVVVWHAPGEVSVSLRSSSGVEQRQVVAVRAGAEVTIGFGRPEPPTAAQATAIPALPVAPPPDRVLRSVGPMANAGSRRPGWAVPGALASGTVAVAGAAMWVGFGIAANSEYNSLRQFCISRGCGPADRPKADAGKAYQLAEYAGIGVASVAAAATATFAVIAITNPSRSKTNSQARWRLLVGAATTGVGCEFP